MSEEEFVEVKVKVPKNVIAALKEYVLEEGETVQQYFERETPGWVAADIDCIACHDPNVDDPDALIEKYGLKKYY